MAVLKGTPPKAFLATVATSVERIPNSGLAAYHMAWSIVIPARTLDAESERKSGSTSSPLFLRESAIMSMLT